MPSNLALAQRLEHPFKLGTLRLQLKCGKVDVLENLDDAPPLAFGERPRVCHLACRRGLLPVAVFRYPCVDAHPCLLLVHGLNGTVEHGWVRGTDPGVTRFDAS
jgi:hypothetical protein